MMMIEGTKESIKIETMITSRWLSLTISEKIRKNTKIKRTMIIIKEIEASTALIIVIDLTALSTEINHSETHLHLMIIIEKIWTTATLRLRMILLKTLILEVTLMILPKIQRPPISRPNRLKRMIIQNSKFESIKSNQSFIDSRKQTIVKSKSWKI